MGVNVIVNIIIIMIVSMGVNMAVNIGLKRVLHCKKKWMFLQE